jgi:hypothetical protein
VWASALGVHTADNAACTTASDKQTMWMNLSDIHSGFSGDGHNRKVFSLNGNYYSQINVRVRASTNTRDHRYTHENSIALHTQNQGNASAMEAPGPSEQMDRRGEGGRQVQSRSAHPTNKHPTRATRSLDPALQRSLDWSGGKEGGTWRWRGGEGKCDNGVWKDSSTKLYQALTMRPLNECSISGKVKSRRSGYR